MLLRNKWYAAAWADEIGEKPLARTILNEPLAIFRADGRVAALRDRCAHRAVPLSKGRVVEGTLECGYHGLRFGLDGRCTLVPGQDLVPAETKVKSYPCVERWRFVWVWIGDADKADPEHIPSLPWLSDPAWVAPTGRIYLRAAHDLLIENLQNHTHLQFVHRSTIGTDNICSVRAKVRRVGDEVHVDRWLLDRPPPALFAKAGGFNGSVDRWFNSVFLPPSTTVLDIGCAKAGTGAPDGDRSQGIEIRSLHVITPETEKTTHYFWAYARNFRIGEPAVTEMLRAGAAATFDEDVEMLEAQQANMDRFPGETPLWLAGDASGVAVRRVRNELASRET